MGSLEGVGRKAEGGTDDDSRFVRQFGATPLYVASQEGHLEVVAALLAQGADVEAKTNVRTS